MIHWCTICGQRATELHHRVFKSKVKPLENCKLNHDNTHITFIAI